MKRTTGLPVTPMGVQEMFGAIKSLLSRAAAQGERPATPLPAALAPLQSQEASSTYVAPDGYVTVLEHRGNFPSSPGGPRRDASMHFASE